MQSQRLFLSIPIPEKMTQSFLEFQRKNLSLEQNGRIKWPPSENFHATLFFLGNVPPQNTPILIQALEDLFSQTQEFSVKFDKFCLYPGRGPHMIWAKFHPNKSFSSLSDQSYRTAKKFIENKFPPNHKQLPHVTMARIKEVFAPLEITPFSFPGSDLIIDHVELWQTEKGHDGSKYKTLARFSLQK